jgi:hypothetical protein
MTQNRKCMIILSARHIRWCNRLFDGMSKWPCNEMITLESRRQRLPVKFNLPGVACTSFEETSNKYSASYHSQTHKHTITRKSQPNTLSFYHLASPNTSPATSDSEPQRRKIRVSSKSLSQPRTILCSACERPHQQETCQNSNKSSSSAARSRQIFRLRLEM